jgi:signal transduction histidine kinase
LQWSETDIQKLVRSAVDSIRPLADLKGISVIVNEVDSGGRIDCDVGRLQQAIGNVLSNAVKFTQKDGRIVIDLDGNADRVRMTVKDTGVGISPEFLPYVFDRFRQADGSSTRSFGGLGLGLSIARHIITMHGGTIQASSAGLNQGTTFTVEIPKSMASLRQSG